MGRPFQMGDTSYTVVGIAGSARLVALQDPDAVEAYYLATDSDLPSMSGAIENGGAARRVGSLCGLGSQID